MGRNLVMSRTERLLSEAVLAKRETGWSEPVVEAGAHHV
jgi:hypothetical protein